MTNDINIIDGYENIKTGRECYDYILNLFNNNSVQFVIIRGFRFLPERMDTDLDIVIHPESNSKFVSICKFLKEQNLINSNRPIEYSYSTFVSKRKEEKKVYYHPLVTNSRLDGRYYRFDTYSDLFFYKNGEGNTKEAKMVNNLFKYYLFRNKIQINNYFIPHPIHEVILLIYRNLYDKLGKWTPKHKNRINHLMNDISEEEFNKMCNLCFKQNQSVFNLLKNKQFEKISEPEQKLNLFIIRKVALQKDVLENIEQKILDEDYAILDKMLITIGDSKKFYSDFYTNFDEFKDEIMKVNKNQCLVFVTNEHGNKLSCHFKTNVRKVYSKQFHDTPGTIGNIIHSSDSFDDCNKELELLFKENVTNFKRIGTYYTYHD